MGIVYECGHSVLNKCTYENHREAHIFNSEFKCMERSVLFRAQLFTILYVRGVHVCGVIIHNIMCTND